MVKFKFFVYLCIRIQTEDFKDFGSKAQSRSILAFGCLFFMLFGINFEFLLWNMPLSCLRRRKSIVFTSLAGFAELERVAERLPLYLSRE